MNVAVTFVITLSPPFEIGDTVDCKINGKPAKVTWRDYDTLVIEPDDARQIVAHTREEDGTTFICAAAEGTRPIVIVPKQTDIRGRRKRRVERRARRVTRLNR